MTRTKVLVLSGTRPEVIKLAPVISALRARPDRFETVHCSTGQHKEMLDQAHGVFSLEPDLDLELMTPSQTLAGLSAALFDAIDGALELAQPDVVLVQGDTTSAFVGATCGFYRQLVVGHVEAGLRTGNLSAPFPEEANRRFVGVVADLHFAPVERARRHLLAEGVPAERVHVTGNTVVDAMHWVRDKSRLMPGREVPEAVARSVSRRRLLLVTSHRRESFGPGLASTCQALRQLADGFPDVEIVYPVHLNPKVGEQVHSALRGHPRIHLLPPVSYPSLLWLMNQAYLILSDSGGIQEEAPSFSKPLLVLRDTTERPEVVESGCARLVGTDPEAILINAQELLDKPEAYARMSGKPNPFGDGHAAERIVQILMRQSSPEVGAVGEVEDCPVG